MEMSQLNKLVENLATARKLKDAAKEEVEAARATFEKSIAPQTENLKRLEDEIAKQQENILQALKDSGTKNWKTEHATVTRKSSVSYRLADKDKVLSYLEGKGLTAEYTTVELTPHIKSLYEAAEVPGVEKVEKEFISVVVR